MGEVKRQPIDVICQHNKDGEIIPMRLRLCDDDGDNQTNNIWEIGGMK